MRLHLFLYVMLSIFLLFSQNGCGGTIHKCPIANVACVKHFLTENPDIDINKTDKEGKTFLARAAKNGQINTVKFLIKQGADVEKPNDKGGTPLYYAVAEGNLKIIKLLIKKGANVNFRQDPTGTILFNLISILSSPKNKNYLNNRYKPEVANKYNEIVKILVKKGAVAQNSYRHSQPILDDMFLCAITTNSIDILKLLIELGANVNLKVKKYNDITPLHIGALMGKIEIVKLLLKEGANVNSKDKYGDTPLHFAALENRIKIAKLLIKNGADKNIAKELFNKKTKTD